MNDEIQPPGSRARVRAELAVVHPAYERALASCRTVLATSSTRNG